MIELRKFETLGAANHGWLDARHHFSFASYHDAARVNWGALRVWNDDTIQAGTGFPTHPHEDMEIITYVRKGAITHTDSMGNEGRTEAGDVQVMSAGNGVRHSEYNREDEDTTLFQIWIIPDERGGEPSWGARQFPKDSRNGQFVPLASGVANDNGGQSDGALPIRANARVLGATVKAGESVTYDTSGDRHLYFVPATGKVRIEDAKDGVEANARDGVAITQMDSVTITALEDSELVLVDAA
ncbi:pirin family protein [Pontixanthobacter aestiaquae]|uniref:Cupin domain-containing protein n=1 Tax=Pontixanthobacter aestiaquae TaxID=1509367 RepID=A0A844Z7Y1_9SPHN|nr:pirin family protein [Pontixanthobacter aestiaquae]MDN3644984.1 pirin family protein [Pontixanthobacter aestiaquae]MXO84015.1 cupin domain-containing protein [Pontixanthobacter aestiaquae]